MEFMVWLGGLHEKFHEPAGLDPLQLETGLLYSVATRDLGELLPLQTSMIAKLSADAIQELASLRAAGLQFHKPSPHSFLRCVQQLHRPSGALRRVKPKEVLGSWTLKDYGIYGGKRRLRAGTVRRLH